jgi:hypothetical protein
MKLLNRPRPDGGAAVISEPNDHTVMDDRGGVRSIQAADVTMRESDMVAMWTPMYLERLARTYWKHLSRVSLGLIRVEYSETERRVVLLRWPLVLLRFRAPEYDISGDRGVVRWRIRDGVLVARRDEGYLEIDVRRSGDGRPGYVNAHVEVEVANFYPAIATWVTRWFYKETQSRIHVLVTHAFLRSLARRELEESAVGRFAEPQPGSDPRPQGDPHERPVNVGDTPWPVVAGLTAVAAAALALAIRIWRR